MEAIAAEVWAGAVSLAPRVGGALLLLVAFGVAARVVHGIALRLHARVDPPRQDAVNLLGQTGRVALIVVGAVTALGTLGVNVNALVAGLGLTGFALGFAFRDVLSNLLAGLLLLFYRPFTRHDSIAVSGFEGRVVGVDLRYTTLEREDGRVLIPNAILFTNPIALREQAPTPPTG